MDKQDFFETNYNTNGSAKNSNNAKYIQAKGDNTHISDDKYIKHRTVPFKRSSVFFVVGSIILSGMVYNLQKSSSLWVKDSVQAMSVNMFPVSYKNNSVADIVKNVSTSVVSINTSVKNELLFNQESRSAGSGVIYAEDDEKLYILTNYHVIKEATEVTISLDDETVFPAHYQGGKSNFDLAVVYVNKSDMDMTFKPNYTVAKFGDSENIEIGQPVIAIGNALGDGKIATLGIISATNKKINIDGVKLNVLQTDAAINPGNSGGALVNADSEIIGINTAKLSTTGVEGMGYSIKSTEARQMAENIMDGKIVNKISLGIQGINIDETIKDMYNFPSEGIYVKEVTDESNAKDAELKSGDLIVGLNDKKILNSEQLSEAINSLEAKEPVKLYIYRENKYPLVIDLVLKQKEDKTSF